MSLSLLNPQLDASLIRKCTFNHEWVVQPPGSSKDVMPLDASLIGKCTFNHEWVVRPPGSSKDVMPLDAAFTTMYPFARSPADSVFQINVFPVHP